MAARQPATVDLKRPALLVTGASGMLGKRICRMAGKKWSVWGVHFRHQLRMDGVQAVQADLTVTSEVLKLFDVVGPQAAIHAAAISQPLLCEEDPGASRNINLKVPASLASICADRGIPFAFTSTDLVFDGLNPPYDEQRDASPVCVYGRHKADAEQAVLGRYPHALVCRLPLMFGFGGRSAKNFSMQMLLAIHQGRPIKLFTDEFRTPVDYQSAARGILKFLGRRSGLLHLGGRTRVSRYDLGLLMAKQLKAAPSMLQPVSLGSMTVGAARSPDCSMDSGLAYSLGYEPLPLGVAVQRIVSQFSSISAV